MNFAILKFFKEAWIDMNLIFDPLPIPIESYASRIGVKVEAVIERHLSGKVPILVKQGRQWFVSPTLLIEYDRGNLHSKGKDLESDLEGPGDGQEASISGTNRSSGGSTEKAARRKPKRSWSNPLD